MAAIALLIFAIAGCGGRNLGTDDLQIAATPTMVVIAFQGPYPAYGSIQIWAGGKPDEMNLIYAGPFLTSFDGLPAEWHYLSVSLIADKVYNAFLYRP
jgi:hypothetical protein